MRAARQDPASARAHGRVALIGATLVDERAPSEELRTVSYERYRRGRWSCVLSLWVLLQSGCSLCESLRGIPAVPAHRVPAEYLSRPRLEMQDISMTRLRQNPPLVYQLGPGDILGVYIETVLGDSDEPLPVHFHEDGGRPPAVGYPVPVREDGTIDLPYVAPIHVTGLTLTQTTEAIRKAYTDDRPILPKGKDRIIVTLMRRRTYQVLVVREESGAQEGVTKRGTGHVEDLAAYENDLLHALNATGGMPGLDAANEVLIFHGMFDDGAMRDHLLAAIRTGGYVGPEDPPMLDDPNAVRIPLRFYPEEVPEFTQDDITLRTGDIVLVKARDREKFYTGGAIPGGEYLLPRDYDLDVLGAIALAGGPLGNGGIGLANGSGNAFGGNRGYLGLSPSRAIVVRKLPCGSEVAIRINLNQALTDPTQRILIQPEDLIVVRYTLFEELYNTFLNLFQFNFLLNGAFR